MSDFPESPPRPPVIPVGLATKLGVVGGALLALAGALAPLLPDTGAGTSKWLVVCATVLTAVTILGRMLQSMAALASAPQMAAAKPQGFLSTSGATSSNFTNTPVLGPEGEMAREPLDDGIDGNDRDLHENELT